MIIVMRTYIPKAGKGGSLMRLVKSVADTFDKPTEGSLTVNVSVTEKLNSSDVASVLVSVNVGVNVAIFIYFLSILQYLLYI